MFLRSADWWSKWELPAELTWRPDSGRALGAVWYWGPRVWACHPSKLAKPPGVCKAWRLTQAVWKSSRNNLGQRYSFSSYLLRIQIVLLDAKASMKRWCTRVAALHPAFRAATEQVTGVVEYQLLFPGLLFILFNYFSVKYGNCTGTNMLLETGIKCAFSKKKKSLRKSECLDATDLNLKAFYFTSQPDLLHRRGKLVRGQMPGTDTTHLSVCGMPPAGTEWQTALICHFSCAISSFRFSGSSFSSHILSICCLLETAAEVAVALRVWSQWLAF